MKSFKLTLLVSLVLTSLAFGLAGCVGYAEVDSGPYYHRDHWYHDGPWMDGPRGYNEVRVVPEIRVRVR